MSQFPHLTEEQIIGAAKILAQRDHNGLDTHSAYYTGMVRNFLNVCAAIEQVVTVDAAPQTVQKPVPILANDDMLNLLHKHAFDLQMTRFSPTDTFPACIRFTSITWQKFCDELRTIVGATGGPNQ